eukprot:15476418-Alexandrium_andersonii.AAC.1
MTCTFRAPCITSGGAPPLKAKADEVGALLTSAQPAQPSHTPRWRTALWQQLAGWWGAIQRAVDSGCLLYTSPSPRD